MKKRVLFISLLTFIFLCLIKFKCLFKLVFGLSCPLCGFTRAIKAFLRLDLKSAFHYHLFFPIIIMFIIIHILYEFKIIKINKKKYLNCLICFSIINLIYYFYRLFNNSNIVYFNFRESLIYKIYLLLF